MASSSIKGATMPICEAQNKLAADEEEDVRASAARLAGALTAPE